MVKLKDPEKIELLAFTGCILLAFLFTAAEAISEHYSIEHHIYRYHFWINLLFSYIVTCICYFLLCFYVQKEMNSKDQKPSNGVVFTCVFINLCFIANIVNEYFTILLAIKMLAIYFTANKQNHKNKPYNETIILFACSVFLQASMVLLNIDDAVRVFFTAIVPTAILHYLYSINISLPILAKKRYAILKFIGQSVISTAVSYILIFFIIYTLYHNIPNIESILLFNLPVQFIFIPQLAWIIYKIKNKREQEEIKTLKTELEKSDANLNFLKSQINPHFLFNALNTLYGTALQEKAERTSEGIQKLGDMMRFMLQENMENMILLSRDIDYLNNYIQLQKLRIATTTDITIETQIEEQSNALLIAPMLLIPFVENAFKHGISLQNPSHIKITLQTKENTLYFDVYNSIQLKQDNDPEKLKTGIGLKNVRERIELLYPNRHELIIRESAKEFFIHLTLQLTGNS